ncbi:MAG: hypothetical protein IMX00_08660 [Limnochordales bacterium]|nr:hypothetical protein [Limnochordales bacterium]
MDFSGVLRVLIYSSLVFLPPALLLPPTAGAAFELASSTRDTREQYAGSGWSGELRLRVDGYAGRLPIPDDGVSDAIQDIRRRELPADGTQIGIRQMTRLRWEVAPTSLSRLRLTLRNYGYWGVGYYTSGSYGIRSFTADPFSIEELAVQFPVGRGMVSLGSQYFQLGSVGLLAATPLSEAEGVAVPLTLGIWEEAVDRRVLALLLGRVKTEFDEESGLVVAADDYAAVRVGIAADQSFSGLNLLLSGRGGEQGISWDRIDAGGSRLEIAVGRAGPASAWRLAGYGEWPIRRWPGWTVQVGYVQAGYPIGYAQLADLGGSLPLASGEAMVGVSATLPSGSSAVGHAAAAGSVRNAAWIGALRVYSAGAGGLSGQARLGWEGRVWPGVMLRAEWIQWALAAGGYGRGRIDLAYQF